jgi:hypothetical protein
LNPDIPRAAFWSADWSSRFLWHRAFTPRRHILACAALAARCGPKWEEQNKSTEWKYLISVVQDYADGRCTGFQVEAAKRLIHRYRRPRCGVFRDLCGPHMRLIHIARDVCWYLYGGPLHWTDGEPEREAQDQLLWTWLPREWPSEWRTSDVMHVAAAVYDGRAVAPILADALEDAGCDDGLYLSIMRSDWQPDRGCWLLDWCSDKL